MDIIYLDYNCFQRSFDDQHQVKIQLEAVACKEIFAKAERNEVLLVWSLMHEDENTLCPFSERKFEVERLAKLCKKKIEYDETLLVVSTKYQKLAGLSSKDAVHVACASKAKSQYLLTCDEELIRKSKRLKFELEIMNPVEYIRKKVIQ
ncbi:MAG: hypothetical protein HYZ33_02995 [Ignavibacteriales bacterium]|nr:hypothetical protein [Ignavibacteriales bacterium]